MVESKFKSGVLILIITSLVLCIGLLFIFLQIGISQLPLYASVPLFFLLLIIIVWIVFVEFRTKAIHIKIEGDTISVKNYLGQGTTKNYLFKEFTGYKISTLSSEYEEFEYLYLLLNGKRVIKISQFYHSNYNEMKQAIIKKTKNIDR